MFPHQETYSSLGGKQLVNLNWHRSIHSKWC